MTDFFDLVHRQRACRQFTDQPVSDEDLHAVLDAARFAPSAENMQPWVFVVVTDPDTRAVIADIAQRAWLGGGREFEIGRISQKLFDDVDQGMTGGFAGAPVHVVVAGDTTATPGLLHSSIFPAVQNLLLAANALGLGSALTTLPTFGGDLGELLGLPEHIEAVAMVPLGHPAKPLGPPRRKPVEEIAHRGRYGVPFA